MWSFLTFLKTQPILSPRQYRWLTYFSDFDTEIIAVEGTKNVIADALSRYAFGTDLARDVDRLKVTFLRNALTGPSDVDFIHSRQGYDLLSIGSPASFCSALMGSGSSVATILAGDEVLDRGSLAHVIDLQDILKQSYDTDAIAKSVLDDNPISYNYRLNPQGIVADPDPDLKHQQ